MPCVDLWISLPQRPRRSPSRVTKLIVLGDVDDILVVDIKERDADQRDRPDRQEIAVLVEDLDAVIFAVSDEEPAAAVDPQTVRQVELARRVARLAP